MKLTDDELKISKALSEYNPLEIDEGGWIPVRNNYPNSIEKKECIFCKLSPMIFYILFDIVGCLFGFVFNPFWVTFEILLGFSYVLSNNKKLKKNIFKKLNLKNILGILTIGIIFRAILFFYFTNYYRIP